MPDHEHILISDPPEYLLTELRKRGHTVTKAYLGDLGYTTDDHIELVCEAIDELMSESQEWTPIIWDQLDPEVQRELMLMAADSDTFMEKWRLPTNYGYEERINRILGLCSPGNDDQPTDD